MAKAKQTPVATAAAKKSSVKVRSSKDIYIHRSKPGTQPYNDVYADGRILKGLSEEERIIEGSRYPFARVISFSKTKQEREDWKKVHSNAKGPVGSMPRPKRDEVTKLLVVNVKNTEKKNDFKNTHSFYAKQSEVFQILKTFFGYKNRDAVKVHELTKVTFGGKVISING